VPGSPYVAALNGALQSPVLRRLHAPDSRR